MSDFLFVLEEDGTIRSATMEEWCSMGPERRQVARDRPFPGVLVSTVFLGIDHGFSGKPLLFETMIFDRPHSGYQTRCSTREEALSMHAAALEIAKVGTLSGRFRKYKRQQRIAHRMRSL